MKEIFLETNQHSEFVDITSKIGSAIPQNMNGFCVVYAPHTTAGVTINEGADPSVQQDILNQLEQMVPWNQPLYRHLEGNSAAHIKASFIGSSVTILVRNGRLQLGTWQKVFFCEFDGARRRKVWVDFFTRD
ncbi:MAG: secondary thiamine-phosphate synthase enzyme YjbQ [Candidatus Hodarchaeota archaeon]